MILVKKTMSDLISELFDAGAGEVREALTDALD